jgi:hypothetical protein
MAQDTLAPTSSFHLPLGKKDVLVHVQNKETGYLQMEGPYIVVCNRFSFKYEDAVMVATVRKYVDDFRLITTNRKADELLDDQRIVCIKKSLLDRWSESRESIINYMQDCIKKKIPVFIFPSRRMTPYNFETIAWDKKLVRAIYDAGVPVIPMCIKAEDQLDNDSAQNVFKNALSVFHEDKPIALKIRVGKPIGVEELKKFEQPKQFRRFLFTKTHALGSSVNVEKFYADNTDSKRRAVGERVAVDDLKQEIETIKKDYLVAQKGSIQVYVCPTLAIPHIMKEIGVLREITYRQEGEGSGKSTDIDEYDLYYRQIFIWDSKAEKIAGGYRVGCGDEIMNSYGRTGFYLHTLFKFEKEFDDIFRQSLDLGRSFVIKEYQKDAFPLFLLWKAIYAFLKQNEQYRYLMGPVSVSATYSPLSRQIIVAFLREHFLDKKLAEHVTPRHPFKETLGFKKKKVLLQQFDGLFSDLDKFIEDIEPGHHKIPVLLKQYIKQNSKFLGFNVDPDFSDALDCLILLDVKKLPSSTVENLS